MYLILSHKRVFQGRFKNEYTGFQQYALGVAAVVAKVRSLLEYSLILIFCLRFLPTFPTMKPLPCLSLSLRRMLECTIKALMEWGWSHLYRPRAKENTLEALSSSLAVPVLLARMVSYDRKWNGSCLLQP